jgi:hypothetical protein
MTEANIESTERGTRRAGPIGRILRFLMAASLIATVIPHYLESSWQSNLKIAAAIGGLIVLYTVMHLIIAKYAPRLNLWLGVLLAIAPATLLFLLGGGIGQMGALSYIGGSLFIDSWNGDIGCEMMAVPGILCGKRTNLVCVAFSPFDWFEQKLIHGHKLFA